MHFANLIGISSPLVLFLFPPCYPFRVPVSHRIYSLDLLGFSKKEASDIIPYVFLGYANHPKSRRDFERLCQ